MKILLKYSEEDDWTPVSVINDVEIHKKSFPGTNINCARGKGFLIFFLEILLKLNYYFFEIIDKLMYLLLPLQNYLKIFQTEVNGSLCLIKTKLLKIMVI